MKTSTLLKSIAFLLPLTLTSCYTSRVFVGNIQPHTPMVEVNKTTNHYLIGGLVPLKNKIEIAEQNQYVGDAKNYEIRTEVSFVNCLITGVTAWIYCPTQTHYLVPLSTVQDKK